MTRRSRWASPAERLAERLAAQANGCLVWTGTVNNAGYGQTWALGVQMLTHRLAWELVHGPIPAGRVVLHACDNPPCCNVEHLSLGSVADNTADMIRKGRSRMGAHQRNRTHCPQGHAYDTANTYVNPTTGRRTCRTCKAVQQRARRMEKAS